MNTWLGRSADSVQFSQSVVSDSLRPHGLQHASLLCPSPTPRSCSNSCPSSQWCHPISVIPFSSLLQSFSASGIFQWVSSPHQGPEVSASVSVNADLIQEGLVDLLTVEGTLRNLLQHHSSKTLQITEQQYLGFLK